ncbi:class I SAM-dependent methyltransferase [Anaerolineales bacterium]
MDEREQETQNFRTNDINESIQKQFGAVARNYQSSEVHSKGADLDLMIRTVAFSGEEVVLDLGCGAGHASIKFAPFVQTVIAYDMTEEMLKVTYDMAKIAGTSNVWTEKGNVEELPYEDESFDLVISRYSAHHWRHPERALNEVARVLKRGGHFILSDVVALENYTADTVLQTIEVLRDPSHVRDYRVSEWREFIRSSGMIFNLFDNFDLPLDFDTWLKRMQTPEMNAKMIRSVFEHAPKDIQEIFVLSPDFRDDAFEFTIKGAVMVGQKAEESS